MGEKVAKQTVDGVTLKKKKRIEIGEKRQTKQDDCGFGEASTGFKPSKRKLGNFRFGVAIE